MRLVQRLAKAFLMFGVLFAIFSVGYTFFTGMHTCNAADVCTSAPAYSLGLIGIGIWLMTAPITFVVNVLPFFLIATALYWLGNRASRRKMAKALSEKRESVPAEPV